MRPSSGIMGKLTYFCICYTKLKFFLCELHLEPTNFFFCIVFSLQCASLAIFCLFGILLNRSANYASFFPLLSAKIHQPLHETWHKCCLWSVISRPISRNLILICFGASHDGHAPISDISGRYQKEHKTQLSHIILLENE